MKTSVAVLLVSVESISSVQITITI